MVGTIIAMTPRMDFFLVFAILALVAAGYLVLDAELRAHSYKREAQFRDEVLEAYKRTRGRIDPAFCCHWRGDR
jgi:hypothetical protein